MRAAVRLRTVNVCKSFRIPVNTTMTAPEGRITGGNPIITPVNTQNVSVTKIVDSRSIQCAEAKYDLRIQFLALVVMIHEVWLNA